MFAYKNTEHKHAHHYRKRINAADFPRVLSFAGEPFAIAKIPGTQSALGLLAETLCRAAGFRSKPKPSL